MHSRNCSLLILLKVIYRLAEKKCLPSGIAESHLKGCCTPETFCQFTLQPIVLSFGHPTSDPDTKQCLANLLYHVLHICTICAALHIYVPYVPHYIYSTTYVLHCHIYVHHMCHIIYTLPQMCYNMYHMCHRQVREPWENSILSFV